MARQDLKMFSLKDLERFVRKVEKLKADGMSMLEVSKALGVPKTTIYLRLRKWKQRSVA